LQRLHGGGIVLQPSQMLSAVRAVEQLRPALAF